MKKIMSIILCFFLLMVSMSFNVSGGDENDPEITDNECDIVDASERFTFPLFLYNFFKNIDILSGWLSESSESPDFITISIKVKDFDFKSLNTPYVFWWTYNDINYLSGFITHSRGQFQVGFAGYIDKNGREIIEAVEYFVDSESNIISLYVSKNLVGNPNVGDELEYPWIWTGARFQNTFLNNLMKGKELAKDFTHPGRTYVIQY